jgi:hypothetical protein
MHIPYSFSTLPHPLSFLPADSSPPSTCVFIAEIASYRGCVGLPPTVLPALRAFRISLYYAGCGDHLKNTMHLCREVAHGMISWLPRWDAKESGVFEPSDVPTRPSSRQFQSQFEIGWNDELAGVYGEPPQRVTSLSRTRSVQHHRYT